MNEDNVDMSTKRRIKIIIILSIVILILLIISFATTNKGETQHNIVYNGIDNEDGNYISTNLKTDLNELELMQELDRIHFYINKFLLYLNDSNFELAYSLLHDDFKSSYFPTLLTFTSYASKHFSRTSTISFTEYNKLGKYHIIDVKFEDLIRETGSYVQKFIVVENGLNDFKISFQVLD